MRASRRAALLYSKPPLGSTWLYTYAQSGQTFTVPVSGTYEIEMHGGGGGGGGYASQWIYGTTYTYYSGSGGSGSGEIYTEHLNKGVTYLITVGAGGAGVASTADGQPGGSSSFGALLSLAGGGSGKAGAKTPVGSPSGSIATTGEPHKTVNGDASSGFASAAGGQGNINNLPQTYGDGGASASRVGGIYQASLPGENGAILVTLVSYT